MRIIGKIHSVDINHKLIGIKAYKRIIYFSLQNSQMTLFKRYLYEGIYIDLDYDEDRVFIRNGIKGFVVNFISQIYSTSIYNKTKYFDKEQINSSLAEFLSNLGNIMFLDLEMTMPSYNYSGKEYKAEIIQAGYILVNGNGDEITRYSNYIKPVVNPVLSKRALKFLNIEYSSFYAKAINYVDFYEDFKEVLELYHPTIVVYGKNDSIILNNSFSINHVNSLTSSIRYVNLCKLIKNYYNLKNDAGLFKLYQIYYENDDLQVHDAFNDCYVTKEVFEAFKRDITHLTNFSHKINKILNNK